MSLPKGRIDKVTVELSGGPQEVHGLTIGQSRIAGKLDGEESIAAAISFATGTDKPDVLAWLAEAPAGDVTKLLSAITDVSGLSQGAQFPQ